MSAAVNGLLSRIIDDTNAEARRVLPAKFAPPLDFNSILDCLYRGHSDMSTELRGFTFRRCGRDLHSSSLRKLERRGLIIDGYNSDLSLKLNQCRPDTTHL
jgi:hypothetical protein